MATFVGDLANNTLTGGSGIDFIDGRGGDDTLYGRGGNDTLGGRNGNDRVGGEAGNDLASGGGGYGNDELYGGTGNDRIDGGVGNDTINPGTGGMTANIAAEATGRILATRLYNLTDDPRMNDMLFFLIARDTMHQQQWMTVIEEFGGKPAQFPIPNRFPQSRRTPGSPMVVSAT